ncbi:LLM class flavin-dependent oxidoreductase [Frankia sp. CNm7]|uniref:LLM class flavin-dependent oxidoreductase n=1 Tax=Frankia nepalensis TaxID=1836974 RepID=A0A937RDW5_9ACTN|nr:LLM class flavin-dependent oxidoreductase [Frankia nepalensis]MBL7500586.1 LLM class flavin-dependent oxidoreductase [Frankia nepalensis]MBL7509360.1 LLM class flavin-dependent oxidoreductase [Frankia nepalensis]MBL7519955.1 LLM class flavin-dependent oxidoreductase [Frankia nepalensis]MBL7630318.1 LLM class flavin-dependent oxidoreductase [Frankia nepalensis]
MRVGVFLFGAVEMGDTIGAGGTEPTARRYGQADFLSAMRRILDTGVLADELGYDAFWLTEHHFQHEGYEVVPNGLLFGAFLAERTRRIRIGTMFNVVGQWHPLRLAEDFAMLHNLSGGRGILGVGRGTVPREMEPLSLGRMSVGSSDNPDALAADGVNRDVTGEALDLLLAALDNETFSHRGRYFQAPPPGIPDRGGEVESLTLIPRPAYPYQVWQAISSPGSLAAVPARGFGGVFWLVNRSLLRGRWDRYAEVYADTHDGARLAPGEKRMVVLNTCLADTREQAMELARPGHDEFWRFLGPYGWNRAYLGPDGGKPPAGWVPTLEDSVDQGVWAVGTAQDVAEAIARLRDDLGGLTDLTIFPTGPGESYDATDEQLRRFARDVRPLLDAAGTARTGAVAADITAADVAPAPFR